MFSFAVLPRDLWASFVQLVGRANVEMRLNHIGYIAKQSGGALLTAVFDDETDVRCRSS
jgi:hypothetical protein